MNHSEPPGSKLFGSCDRVKRRSEYRQIQSRGAKVHTRHFILLVHPSLVGAEHARLGVTITKKVGNAVERNRVRRVFREVFRLHRDLFPLGSDIVAIAKRGAPTLGFEDVLAEIRRARRALQRAPTQTRVKEVADRNFQGAKRAADAKRR